MSHKVNDTLIEEAKELINSGELSSTPLEKMLEADLQANDLDSMWRHLVEARDFLRDDDWEVADVY